jgi:hypothetical protein
MSKKGKKKQEEDLPPLPSQPQQSDPNTLIIGGTVFNVKHAKTKKGPKSTPSKEKTAPITSQGTLLKPGRHECNCEGTKHAVLTNCLTCGKIVCEQEGYGPCHFCEQHVVPPPMYKNIILMGDFNADCSYVPASQWQNIRFKQVPYSSQFTFVVPDGSDTTVSTNVCAYDRFVMNSTVAAKRVVPRGAPTSGYVYHFPLVYNMNLTDAAKISDHVPIEMTFMYDVNSSPTPSPTPTATTNSASDRKLVPTVTLLISLLAVVLLG